jgi:hypothetical protein
MGTAKPVQGLHNWIRVLTVPSASEESCTRFPLGLDIVGVVSPAPLRKGKEVNSSDCYENAGIVLLQYCTF